MAKVVLVWNEHPTEVVAGFHARKVAKILREKYGHEVVVEKVPVGKTNYGIVRSLGRKIRPSDAAVHLSKLADTSEISKKYSEKHGAPVFNFHGGDQMIMRDAEFIKPKDFRTGEIDGNDHGIMFKYELTCRMPFEINFLRYGTCHFAIELPSEIIPLSPKNLEKRRNQINRIKAQIKKSSDDDGTIRRNLRDNYHLKASLLSHPSQQKYLHPAISEKIAAAIHERITRKEPRQA